jgi:cysteinyl-tRNA synthetase
MLYIHNNLTKQKEAFEPIDSNNVRMYVCGMTVYDYCHIGHARVLVVFDVVYRYLCHLYGEDKVTYVRNITDIDDKIIQRANERKLPFTQLTDEFIRAMHEDAEALSVLPPNQEPRATHNIDDIIRMIEALIQRGHAYAADNGDVYYDVSSFADYGRLSGKQLDDLRAGARVEVDEAKQDPLDFVLWKAAKPGEPSWPSPWGDGRPGWHIECSAMSTCCLGEHFDIHGGGLDLQFPHHENEIAQSEGATGHKFVNYWMHNGFVRVDDEKMSKSLGNFFTIREVLARYHPEAVRYFILNSHYRSPLNYSDQHLDGAHAALNTLYTALRDLPAANPDLADARIEKFMAAMNDDFNTAETLAVLFDFAHEINKYKSSDTDKAAELGATMRYLANLLGILQREPDSYLKFGAGEGGLSDAEIDGLIAQRNQAREDKNWVEADRIRDELQANGIVLEDKGGVTSWRRG